MKIVKSRKIDSSLFITISCLEKLKLFLKQAEVVGFWCTVLVLTKRSVLCLSLADRLNLPLVTVVINVIIYYRIQAIAKCQLYNLTWMRVTARQCFPSAEVPAPVTVTLCQGPKTWINIVFLLGQSINWKKKKKTLQKTQLGESSGKSITHLHIWRRADVQGVYLNVGDYSFSTFLYQRVSSVFSELTLPPFCFSFLWRFVRKRLFHVSFIKPTSSVQTTDGALCNWSCGLLQCSPNLYFLPCQQSFSIKLFNEGAGICLVLNVTFLLLCF